MSDVEDRRRPRLAGRRAAAGRYAGGRRTSNVDDKRERKLASRRAVADRYASRYLSRYADRRIRTYTRR